jgi:hypothetical protein
VIVDKRTKGVLLENVSMAAILGLLALLVSAASMALDSAADRRDRDAIARLGGVQASGVAPGSVASSLGRIYTLTRNDKRYYGAVIEVGDQRGLARVAAIITADGKLDSAQVIGIVPPEFPAAADGWFSDFLGKGGDAAFPFWREDSRRPETVSGATESFMATSSALSRLSRSVMAIASADAGGKK